MICPALTVIANGVKDAMAYKIGVPKAALILLGLGINDKGNIDKTCPR